MFLLLAAIDVFYIGLPSVLPFDSRISSFHAQVSETAVIPSLRLLTFIACSFVTTCLRSDSDLALPHRLLEYFSLIDLFTHDITKYPKKQNQTETKLCSSLFDKECYNLGKNIAP